MKNINTEIEAWVQFILFLVLWGAVLAVSDTHIGLTPEALKTIPEVVTLYLIVRLLFTHWGWRLPILQGWVVPLPDLQGTWKGTISSTWANPTTNQAHPSIPVLLAVRQTFDSISCAMYTVEMSSHSGASILKKDDGSIDLTYTYISEPKIAVRAASQIHKGAVSLKVIRSETKELEGEYWTDRNTTGSISVEFVSRKLADKFDPDWQG